jgi:anti-anti-sigma regulatory factor
MATAADFGKAATWIVQQDYEVVLDIADLSFIDSAGLRAIVRLAEEACP